MSSAGGTRVEPIRLERRLPVSPGDAFGTFTDRLQAWWPRAGTWSGEVLETIAIEPRVGGFCYERGPHGLRLDWGRVVTWEPPHRLVFSWQVGPDRVPVPNPAHASEVEVTFTGDGDGSRITLEHRGWERHGAGAQRYRDAMAGEAAGWPAILARFVGAVERRAEAPWEGLTT